MKLKKTKIRGSIRNRIRNLQNIKIETAKDSSPERRLLIGMIVSTPFLAGVRQFLDLNSLNPEYARPVAEWCLRHYERYEKAPGLHIRDIFDAHARRLPPSRLEMISELLAGLSREYERKGKMNVPYLLDQAETLIKERSLKRLNERVSSLLEQGQVAEAEAALSGYKRVGRPGTLGRNPFRDSEAVRQAFEQVNEPLFTWPGALGRIFNRYCSRDQFVALTGPEKRGKTWWLNEWAIRAARARCNVALFQLGDMSEEQVIRRLGCRLCRKSDQLPDPDYPLLMPVPDCREHQLGQCPKGRKCPHGSLFEKWSVQAVYESYLSGEHSEYRPCARCMKEPGFRGSFWYEEPERPKEPLDWREAYKTGSLFCRRLRGRDFRLSVHAADQLSVEGLNGILDSWEVFDNFIADVIVIDYADNLDCESGYGNKDERHKENKKWKSLRAMSQNRHALVVTATQSAGRSYLKTSVDMSDYSEDKRKHGHVTAEYGLNQTPEEKRAGIMRIGVVVQREGQFFSDSEVYVPQALWAGQPAVFSFR